MQALDHMMNGDQEKALEILRQIPTRDIRAELEAMQHHVQTLSDAARYLEGNREQRRAAARSAQ